MPTPQGDNSLIEISSHSDLGSRWRECFRYRDLLWLLIKREWLSQVKQTYLGSLWILVHPLATALVLTLVFARAMRIDTDGVPPPLFYLCGLLIWNFFSQSLLGVATGLKSSVPLFSKVYFPRLIVPLAVLGWRAILLAIQGAVFLFFYFAFAGIQAGGFPNPSLVDLLMLPLVVLGAAGLALGIGLTIAALTARYRDLHQVLVLAMQLWLYGSPILYPYSAVNGSWRILLALNPLTPMIELFRRAFFSTPSVPGQWLFFAMATSLVFALIGLTTWEKVEGSFVDEA